MRIDFAGTVSHHTIGINTSFISADDVRNFLIFSPPFRLRRLRTHSGYADATLTTNAFIEAAKRTRDLIQICDVTAIR